MFFRLYSHNVSSLRSLAEVDVWATLKLIILILILEVAA